MHHVSGASIDNIGEYQGVKIRSAWTLEKKGQASMASFISVVLSASRSSSDIVQIHAEGPVAMYGLIRLLGHRGAGRKKRIVFTVHGDANIISRKNIELMAA